RAQELGQVGGVEGDEVPYLVALRLRDGHPLAGGDPPPPRVPGGNHELAGIGDHSRCPRLLRGFSSAPVRRGVRPEWGLVLDWVVRSARAQQAPEETPGALLAGLADPPLRPALFDDAAAVHEEEAIADLAGE